MYHRRHVATVERLSRLMTPVQAFDEVCNRRQIDRVRKNSTSSQYVFCFFNCFAILRPGFWGIREERVNMCKLSLGNNLGNSPVTGFHHLIASRLRAGFNLPVEVVEFGETVGTEKGKRYVSQRLNSKRSMVFEMDPI
ncbi:hypothetical protein BT96DRAFT_949019 [Gymnopus androsaceus JB14]|uniref:Uncharacterized protein n=1 Tax=Gymnopus androsaceus JB14 TaxID=1447944 RepID=A0A6A4GLL7_9AGAR|nr:hypothetical protein BT96DRAFT_949019 [Gymnopus androsaceus JB14]